MGKRSFYISLLCISAGAVTLFDCRAFYAPYLIAAVFSVYCLFKIKDRDIDRNSRKYRIVCIVSFVAAVFVTLANYALWLHPDMPDIRTPMFVRICKLLLILIIMSGSFSSVLAIMTYTVYDPDSFSVSGKLPSGKRPWLFFLVPFVIISGIYLTIYMCCYYPGLLSVDSIDQVTQIFSGEYSNHQPFFHTMIVGVFLRMGLAAFSDINRAVAFYAVFQVLFMAATFSFTIHTMAKLKMPVWCEVAATAFYALMPYHIMYSYTVWKDVYFGAFVTLLIVFFIRLYTRTGNTVANTIGFAACGPIICLIRSNGLFAYAFVFLAMLLLARKEKKLILIMLITMIASFAAKHTMLPALNVTAPDTVESLSIPLQQIARVVADDGVIADEDQAFLEQIIDTSTLKDVYDPDISDPVKNAIRDHGDQDFLSQNMGGFAGMYLRTFVHNPMEYIIAWVDSTCGYWNAGYDYWIWYWDIEQNPWGITRTVHSESVLHFMDEYLWLFYNNRILQVFTSIGLAVWIALLALAKGISRNDRLMIIATVPPLAIMLSLIISSPVFSEFRYMYALYCALPLLCALMTKRLPNGEDPECGESKEGV